MLSTYFCSYDYKGFGILKIFFMIGLGKIIFVGENMH